MNTAKEGKSSLTRRSFLTGAALFGAGIAATGLAGCSPKVTDGTAIAEDIEDVSTGPWYGAAADESSFKISEEIETEILICGAGHGGMTAAMVAGENGVKTIVIEKGSEHGIFRSFPGAVNAQVQKDAGLEIDGVALANDLMRYASGRADQALINLWINESGECYDWLSETLAKRGITLTAETDVGTGYHGVYQCWPTQLVEHIPDEWADLACATPNMAPGLISIAEEDGVEFKYNHSLVQFCKDGDRVDAAIVKDADGIYTKIKASKGILLATGGYEGNSSLFEKLNPQSASTVTCCQYMPQNTGEGLEAGIWAGGVKDEHATCMLFDRGGIAPGKSAGLPAQGELFWMGSQPFLKNDVQGKRIANEDAPYDNMINAASLRKEHVWCSLWDANYTEQIKQFHTISCSRIDPSPTPGGWSFTYEAIAGMNEGLKHEGIIFEADTIEELAEKLEVPADTLVETVRQYNEMAAAGKDTVFGKDSKDLFPLDTPPYCGARVGSALLCTLDGLGINTDCQLTDENEEPIPGLWAAGNVTGGFFADNYPELIPGCASGRTSTEARHAILNMLGEN